MYFTGYTCVSCGHHETESYEGYTCPSCGGNLSVIYDYEAIRGLISDHRLLSTAREDIFRYSALLPIESTDHAPPLRIGSTPLYHAQRLGDALGMPHLYLKDDALNPSHSFKDRASAVVLTRAVEQGVDVVAGASTGNAGSSMACLSASLGRRCVIFVPVSAPAAKITQLLVFGATVLAVRGTYDDAFDLCGQVCKQRGWLNRNTGFNPFTREGKKTVSFEICEQLSWQAPDRVLVSVGDGNIISGVWKGFRELHDLDLIEALPKIDCIQARGSAAVTAAVHEIRNHSQDAKEIDWASVRIAPVTAATIADSIAVDQPRDGIAAARAVIESGGEAVSLDDDVILRAIPELARGAGVFAEPSAAAVYAGLQALLDAGTIDRAERVVCLLTGSGLKDVNRAREAAGKPTVIDPTIDAAEAALSSLMLVVFAE